MLSFFLQCCCPKETDRVLDLGTGTGAVASALAPHVHDVMGVDREPTMLQQARLACPQVEYREMEIEQLDLPDRSFDLLTARMVLHHITDLDQALSEARRLLVPGGRLVVCEGVPPDDRVIDRFKAIFHLKEPGRHIFTEKSLVGLIKKAGFTKVQIHPFVMSEVSLKNWLAGSNLPSKVSARIEELHRTADAHFWSVYRMKSDGDDLKMDWKFIIVTAFRPTEG